MKIVVLDHVYLEDRHAEKLMSLGDVRVFKEPAKTERELIERIGDAEIVIVGWSHLTKKIIESTQKLKMISIWATTCHYADIVAARAKGIVVSHVPGYATEAVAEYTFALMLVAIRKLILADHHVREGKFDWRPFSGRELAGKTLGVIGTGVIGCRVAEIARVFKMRVLGFDKYPNLSRAGEAGIEYVGLDKLLRESDIVTLHVTLSSETEKLIGEHQVASMKEGAIIINTSQGKVVDEKALTEALKSGKLSFAGLDVLEEEPPVKNNPLFKLDNVVLSPHVGFNTVEATARCTDICIENVESFIKQKQQNLC